MYSLHNCLRLNQSHNLFNLQSNSSLVCCTCPLQLLLTRNNHLYQLQPSLIWVNNNFMGNRGLLWVKGLKGFCLTARP